MSIDYEADVEGLSAEGLSRVSTLAKEQAALELQIANAEDALKKLNERLRSVVEVQLPDAMGELGLTSLTLDDGSRIDVSTEYYAEISGRNQPRAFAWLRETGNDSIIKREFKINFGKGEDAAAASFRAMCEAQNFGPSEKLAVHPQTLRAFVREQIEAGAPLPQDVFGVHIINKARIKR